MGQLKDLTGQKIGKLTVLRRVEDKQRGRPMWLCQCECGNQTVVSSTRLLLPNGTFIQHRLIAAGKINRSHLADWWILQARFSGI